jgi:hypothetical protein
MFVLWWYSASSQSSFGVASAAGQHVHDGIREKLSIIIKLNRWLFD